MRWSKFLLVAALAQQPMFAFAQGDDALARAKLLREVAESKAEADATNAIAEADKLAKASVPTAVKSLKNAIFALDKSFDISAEKRASLVKRLEAKIAALEGRPAAPAAVAPRLSKEDERKLTEAAKVEAKDVKDGVAEIGKHYDNNKFADAQAKIAELTKKYPNNPAVIVLNGQGYVADRVADARELSRQQAERIAFALNDVDRSALPAKGDIEFPKGWAEKMERRDKLNGIQLDAETEAILEALERQVKPGQGIKNGPFEEVIETLATITQKNIYLNREALLESGTDLKKPVSLPDGVSVRTALRAVLQANGLTFVIKDKSILVVRPDEARKMLVKRAYYMGDVLSSPLGGGATFGPLVDFNIATQNANLIIDSIKKSIDPLGWSGQGGDSTILFHAPSMSIIVSAPAEVHFNLSRATRKK